MKPMRILVITLLLLLVSLPNVDAKDSSQWVLPENAIARIGKGQITDMAYSPDGKLLAVGTSIGTWLYDAHTGGEVALLTAHTGKVTSVAFSPDGMTLATVDYYHTIYLWDISTREHKATLAGSTKHIAFSPDGDTLASAGRGHITLWDTNTLEQKTKFSEKSYGRIAFSPDSAILASGDSDEKIRLWDVHTGQHKITFNGDTRDIAFSPDGNTLASANWSTIHLLDPKTGKQKTALTGHTRPIHSVTFSPNSEILASGGGDNTVRLWNPNTGKHITTLTGHKVAIETLAFSPDGVTLASGSYDGTIQFWDTRTGQHKSTIRHAPHRLPVSLSPDGKTIATGGYEKVILWDIDTREPKTRLIGHTEDMFSLSFSADGTILMGNSAKEHLLWNIHTGERLDKVTFSADDIFSNTTYNSKKTLSPDGTILTIGKKDGMIELWDTQTRKRKVTLTKPANDVSAIAFSANGNMLATASYQQFELWDTDTGEPKATHPKQGISPTVLVFSMDGTMLAGGDGQGEVHLWNIKTGIHIPTSGHQRTYGLDGISSLAFSADGTTLASGSMDYTVRLWDTATGHFRKTFGGHPREINASSGGITWLAFSTTDATLFSRSEDGTIHIWDATPVIDTDATVQITPSPIQSPAIGEQLILNIAITDGKRVTGYDVTVEFDETVLHYVSSQKGEYIPGDASFDAQTSKVMNVEDFHNVTYLHRVRLISKAADASTSANGTLASITFEVIKTKTSTVSLPKVRLEKSDGSVARPHVTHCTVLDPLQAQNVPTDYTKLVLPEGVKARLGKGTINDIKFSSDNTKLFVASSIGIWVYDANTGDELALLTEHMRSVNSIKFSADGELFISSGADGRLRMWNSHTYQPLKNFKSSDGAIAFSPDRRTLFNGRELWDAKTGQPLATIKPGNIEAVTDAAFSPNGKTLATTTREGKIELWDVNSGQRKTLLHEGQYSNSYQHKIALAADGTKLAAIGSERNRPNSTILLWNTQTGELLKTYSEKDNSLFFLSMHFSAKKELITVSKEWHKTLHIQNFHTEENLAVLKGHTEFVYLTAFSPDKTTLVSAGRGGAIHLWDIETGKLRTTITGHTLAITSIAMSTQTKTLVTAHRDQPVQLWDLFTLRHKGTIQDENGHFFASAVTFSPDNTTLAGGRYEQVWLWDTNAQEKKLTITKENRNIETIAFSPNGRTLTVNSRWEHTMPLWNAYTGEHKLTLKGHAKQINALAFSPNGAIIATAETLSDKGEEAIRLWDAKTGALRTTIANLINPKRNQRLPVIDVVFSPDGETLASADVSSDIQLWDADAGKHKTTLKAYPDDFHWYEPENFALAFSPDGKTLVSTGYRSTINVWNMKTGKHQDTLTGHTGIVTSLTYSEDGTTLASGSTDGTVLLWQMKSISDTRLNITPFSVQSPPTGKELTFNINMTDGKGVTGYQFTLQYDAKALRYIPNPESESKIKNIKTKSSIMTENTIKLTGNASADSTIDGGTIATVTFEILKRNDVTLTLTDALLTYTDGKESGPIVGHAWVVEPPRIPEDVNRDWQLDAADLDFVASRLGQKGKDNSADVNGDGVVDIADLVLIRNALYGAAPEPTTD